MLEVLAVATVAWGVGAFGAVYSWAYVPLIAMATVVSVTSLLHRDDAARRSRLPAAAAAIAIAIGLQLLPLPPRVLTALSPSTDRILSAYDLSYAARSKWHSLSIDPVSTTLALACFVAFALFSIGVSRRLTVRRAAMVARAVAVLALVVAVVGVVQKSTGTLRIYGFWTPIDHPYQVFGPFVNKNHFAGWMVMALSLTIGSLGFEIVKGARSMKASWRGYMGWLSTSAGSYVLLMLFAVPVMISALLMTLSRSAILSWFASIAFAGFWLVVSTRRSKLVLMLAGMYVVIALTLVTTWANPRLVSARFEHGSGDTLRARMTTWGDALRIADDFPLSGTGLNTFDTAMIFYQSQPGAHWSAAHNDYIQVVADGGILLVVPVVVALIVGVREFCDRARAETPRDPHFWLRAGAVVGLVAIGIQECFDFSLQLPGNAVMCALLIAFAIRPIREQKVDQKAPIAR